MGVYDCDNYNDLMARIDRVKKRNKAIDSPTPMSGTSDLISRQAVIDLWEQYKPYIAVKACEYDSELRKLPSIQPDWDEMVVICDNCGHAIHVKGGEQNDKRKSD